MQEIKLNKAKTYTVPDGANKLQIVHEWGDTVLADTTVSTDYTFTPNSIGVHKFVWKNGTTVVSTVHYECIANLLTATEFFTDYPSLEVSGEDSFNALERRVRRLIQNFTQQKFGPYYNKTQTMEGQGGDSLELRYRLIRLIGVTDEVGTDYTEFSERSPNSEYFIQKKTESLGGRYGRLYWDEDIKRDLTRDMYNQFSARHNFTIVGDWGWEYVPQDVTEAAMLLISDEMSGVLDLRKHGFTEGQLGDFSYRLAAEGTTTTGNTQADALLAPYILMNIGLV